MGIEKRSGRWYFFEKERTSDGVQSVYIGRSQLAYTRAIYDQLLYLRADYIEEDVLNLAGALERIDPALDAAAEQLRAVAAVLLVALGYHCRKGQWRRRQGVPTWTDSGVPFPNGPPPPAARPRALRVHPNDLILDRTCSAAANVRNLKTLYNTMERNDYGREIDRIMQQVRPEFGADAKPGIQIDFIAAVRRKLGEGDAPSGDACPVMQKVDQDAHPRSITFEQRLRSSQQRALDFIDMLWKAGPNRTTANAVRSALAVDPGVIERSGAFMAHVARAIAKTFFPGDLARQYALLVGLDQRRMALGCLEALPHERPFIDQVALMQAAHQVTLLASTAAFPAAIETAHLRMYWAKRVRYTEDRLARAIERLARLRRHTRATKAVQGDLAAYLRQIAPPPEERADAPVAASPDGADDEPRWQWAPAEPPDVDFEDLLVTPAEPQAVLASQPGRLPERAPGAAPRYPKRPTRRMPTEDWYPPEFQHIAKETYQPDRPPVPFLFDRTGVYRADVPPPLARPDRGEFIEGAEITAIDEGPLRDLRDRLHEMGDYAEGAASSEVTT